jgi:hypothetical protein
MKLAPVLTRTHYSVTILALLSSCYRSTVTAEPTSTPTAERRELTAPDEPVVVTDWTLDGHIVRGTLTWQSCVSEKSWTTSERRTLHRDPDRLIGGVLAIGGLGLFGAGVLSRKTESTTTCTGAGACSAKDPDNSLQTTMIISGLALAITGSVILLGHSSEQTEESSPEEHHKKGTIPCVGPADLGGLELSVLLPNHQVLPVEMSGAQHANVRLPKDVQLASGGKWPVVVSRVPRGARDFLSEGEVVGAVRQ